MKLAIIDYCTSSIDIYDNVPEDAEPFGYLESLGVKYKESNCFFIAGESLTVNEFRCAAGGVAPSER